MLCWMTFNLAKLLKVSFLNLLNSLCCTVKLNECFNGVINAHGSVSCDPRSWRATPMRKNNNWIFTYMYLWAAFMKPNDFCCRDALHQQYPTFQIVTKPHQAFLQDINFQKLA